MNKITLAFRRPAIIAFGWTVFIAGMLLTLSIGYSIAYLIAAVWPAVAEGWWKR